MKIVRQLLQGNCEQTSVQIKPPTQVHTESSTQLATNSNGKKAIENGKLKALQWCDTLGARLGDCTKVIEIENSSTPLGKELGSDPIQLECKVELTFDINRD